MNLLPASKAENIIWKRFLDNPSDEGLVLSYGFYLHGYLDKVLVQKVLQEVVKQGFPNLLCYFFEDKGKLYKQYQPNTTVKLTEVNFTPNFTNETNIDHASDQLYYFCYQEVNEKCHFLGLQFSHLLFDGNCYEEFLDAFEAAWAEAIKGKQWTKDQINGLPTERIEYTENTAKYWGEKLQTNQISQTLPFAKKVNRLRNQHTAVKEKIEGLPYEALTEKLSEERISLFQFLMTAFSVTLFKYDTEANSTIHLSHTVSTRKPGQAPGCYLNIIPFSIAQSLENTPEDYLQWVKTERRAVRPHQDFPTSAIVKLASEKLNRGNNLFNVVINHSQGLIPTRIPRLEGIKTEMIFQPATGGPFDLALNYSYDGQALKLSFDANAELISPQILEAFVSNFLKTLDFFVNKTKNPIEDLSFATALSPAGIGQTIPLNNRASLSEQMQMQLEKWGHKNAVVYHEKTLSYQNLLEESLLLGRKLIAEIPEAELRKGIGLYLSRSELLPIAMLTSILLEVPFIPIEASLPIARINYMLDAAEVKVLLSDETALQNSEVQDRSNLKIIKMDAVQRRNWEQRNEIIWRKHGMENAYIMFTSGSTGNPKGVMLSATNLLNFLYAMESALPISAEDYFFAITSVSFDISILELLLPLFIGGTFEVIDDDVRRSATALAKKINSAPVTCLQTTPSVWRLLKAANWMAERPMVLLSGGEALEKEIAAYLLTQGTLVYNMYGPTEATIWASVQRISDAEKVLLGEPTSNTELYVVDEAFRSVTAGMSGQLVITGDCVGLGYLNYDSSQVFVQLPDSNRKAYMTGDFVRYLGDGQIEFMGRKSSYRKINGYRIETDEITASLKKQHPEVDFVTVVREKPEAHLCCFYWSGKETNIDEESTLKTLANVLPYYMIPRRILQLNSLPLTPSGKLNTKLLSTADVTQWTNTTTTKSTTQSQRPQETCPILAQLKQILAETLEVNVEDSSTPLGYLGLTSISYNHLTLAIEQHFGVTIATHEFYQLIDLNGVRDAIKKRSEPNSFSQPVVSVEKQNQPTSKKARSEYEKQKIAIIGYAVLMPQNLEAEGLWQALLDRKNLISAESALAANEGEAGFMKEVEQFDARFFSISPLEASHMDPRQRLLLQTAWRTIEDAAYPIDELKGKNVGCYVAAAGNDYASLQAKIGKDQIPFSLSGYSLSILSNRISNFFDWHGPSFSLDTACSGGLSALVKGCNDLSFNVCDAAFVAGVNLILDNQIDEGLKVGRFMSPNKRCATFDQSADGYVRGEGLGGVLIKRLDDAIRDGDHIHGVIESYVENHGGRSSSLTAPNPNAQIDLLLNAYTPTLAQELSYLETHGTGTRLGDPIEIDAIKQAWEKLGGRDAESTIWLGALKSNIGHLEAAAGIASLTKVLLALKYRKLPPNIHFNQLNPLINLENTPFKILEEARVWNDQPVLKAGISSFGFGGANAHIVVSEAPTQEGNKSVNTGEQLFVLSAKSEESLREMGRELYQYLSSNRQKSKNRLADIAYTLSVGRSHFEYRTAWLGSSVKDCLDFLHREFEINTIERSKLNYELSNDLVVDEQTMLITLKTNYLQGARIPWESWYVNKSCQKMSLPTYRFAKKYFRLHQATKRHFLSSALPKKMMS